MIAAEWTDFTKGSSPIEVWQNKIRHLRRFLKGWAKNQSGKYKVEKENCCASLLILMLKLRACCLMLLNARHCDKIKTALAPFVEMRRLNGLKGLKLNMSKKVATIQNISI
jgi:hypothetical protein